jgi:predicted dehydrogenase
MTRLVVAGAGAIGRRHLAHIDAHPDLHVAALIDPNPATSELTQAPRFDSLADCGEDADGIVIATPTQDHEATFAEAARRGWHALIEKPLAPDLASVDRMIAAAEAAGVHILTGHHRRFHPKVTALKAILDAGTIGQPIVATSIWNVRKPDGYFDVGWRKGRDGAPVHKNVSHEVDLLRFLFGEITRVAGLGGNPVRQEARVESGAAVLGFASGLTASVTFADTTPSPWGFEHGTGENPNIAHTGQDSLRISGTRGAVEFPSLRVWTGAYDWSEAPVPQEHPSGDGTPLILQLEHFARVIAGAEGPLNDARSGRATMAATLDIERATWPEGVPA